MQSTQKQPGIIVYELNEVPWRVIDRYIECRPTSFLAKNLESFSQLTTLTRDSGELHPWSTWPTVHRGVSNDSHQIRYINQDRSCAERFPPIWDILAECGVSVGVFGSLQSYPPGKSENIEFYVPDTFAPDAAAYPERGKRFQEVNLRLAGKNKASAASVGAGDLISSSKLFVSGVRPRSALEVGKQLLRERSDPRNKGFRPAIQAYIGFDVFWSLLNSRNPRFVTFFTNHVAGLMHRYWRDLFPEDFPDCADYANSGRFHEDSILRGMDIADAHIERCYEYAKKNCMEFVILSSMGQAAIDRGKYTPELVLRDGKKIVRHMGYDPEQIAMRPAMQPDVVFELYDGHDLAEFTDRVLSLKDSNREKLFSLKYPPRGNTLNVSLRGTEAIATDSLVRFGEDVTSIDKLGIELLVRDQGTAYHIPEGILLWTGQRQIERGRRSSVDSCSFFPTVLNYFGIQPPDYCEGELLI